MINNFFTPEEISTREKNGYKVELGQGYDFALLQQDVFQIVSPHIESISDRKHKIISWLKKAPLVERMNILTFTNKEFVCMIRAMYEKKQSQYQDQSSTAFTISHVQQTDQFDLLCMVNTKKLSEEYLATEDQLLSNIQIMSRYTQFDSITFNQSCIRNIEPIFNWFQILGNGIAYELTVQHYQRLKSQPNSVMFYDPREEHCYKKAPLGTWITEVFMKHISMKYLQQELSHPDPSYNDIKQKNKQFQKYWKIITPQKKNAIIKKVLPMKPIDLYQQHRAMIKVTRNGFPPIEKSDKVPSLLKNILNSNQKSIFQLLFYTDINETLESHSVLKFYITLELQDEIKQYNSLQKDFHQANKTKKKINKVTSTQANKVTSIQSNKVIKTQNKKFASTQANEVEGKFELQKSAINTFIEKTFRQFEQQPVIKEKEDKMEGKKMMVKGTDLFYKKLEVSSTQHIVSFEANCEPSVEDNLKQLPSGLAVKKSKKNKKNKNKNESNSHEENKTQPNILQQNHPLNQSMILSIGSNDKAEQKQQMRQSSTRKMDQSSEKQSKTTSDQTNRPKDQNHQTYLKNQQKEFEPKSSDPLDLIIKNLQKKMNFYNKQRKIVINRLMYVFAQHKLSFKVYGSSSCDAALPTSDIDIVVDPSIVDYFFFSYANYKKKIISSLEYLQKVFEKFEWAADFILLPGANIPLLTFTVNPGIEFDLEHGNYFYNNRKMLKQQIKISVDITIQPYVNMIDQVPMHLGVESSQLIKQWISMFPFYSQILVLLKLFTKNQDLNKSYHGGISSFMQAVMLADFYKNICFDLKLSLSEVYAKKQKFSELIPSSWNLSTLFISYCKFIAQFDQQKQIFDVNAEKNKTFKETAIINHQFCIINPLTGKIMSERCTIFPLYKKLLTELHQRMSSKDEEQLFQYLHIVFEA